MYSGITYPTWQFLAASFIKHVCYQKNCTPMSRCLCVFCDCHLFVSQCSNSMSNFQHHSPALPSLRSLTTTLGPRTGKHSWNLDAQGGRCALCTCAGCTLSTTLPTERQNPILLSVVLVLTVQNHAQVHRKPTGDLVPFSPRRVLPRFVNPMIGSKLLGFSI
jgi:hypothetical protein